MNLFAPISLELSSKKIGVNKNVANASDISLSSLGTMALGLRTKAQTECLTTASSPQKGFCFAARTVSTNSKVSIVIYLIGNDLPGSDLYSLDLKIKDSNGVNFTSTGATFKSDTITDDANLTATFPSADKSIEYDGYVFYIDNIPGFKVGTTYTFDVSINKRNEIAGAATVPIIIATGLTVAFFTAGIGGALATAGAYAFLKATDLGTQTVTIPDVNISGDTNQIFSGSTSGGNTVNNSSSMPACSMGVLPDSLTGKTGTFMGCVAQGIYYVLFSTTSYLFGLAGTLFDNAFAYSVDDNSYRSAFVVEGWKVVRDFCNMFFIFILLYIAFGTILNLNGVKTKEMIINVVLIGIFINFSLFASQVIIDASNILARVFYNSNTITIKVDDSAVGSKVIPLSEALVNKINPQQIILSASQINITKDTRGKSGSAVDSTQTVEEQATSISTGTFILVTILATIVNLVGVFVFFSIAIIFISRVIGLWLAMIFAPFAFLSYTVPAMQNFDMVGWKKWWPETLKLAFLAPVFIFFLYLILQFLETGLGLIQTDTKPLGISLVVGVVLPFAFIMILLLKAKDIATKMSGTIGETLAKAGATVGGMAVGAAGGFALGGIASLGRATVGNLGDKLATSEFAKTHGAVGRGLQDLGKWTSGKSFDVRATKLGATAQKTMGVDLGKAKEGGYVKHQADITAKRRDRAERIKLGDQTPQVQELHHAEEELSNLRNERVNDTNRIDGTLAAKRLVGNDFYQKLTAANAKLANDPTNTVLKAEAKAAQEAFDDNAKTIDKFTKERIELNDSTGRYSHKTGDGKVNKKGFDDYKTNVVDTSEVDTSATIAKANADMLIATTDEEKGKLQKIIDDATKENNDIKNIFAEMEAAVQANGYAEENEVHSINKLALNMIPELHHKVEKENADRVNEYAKTIRNRFFNTRANDKAAHEAIMRSEIKKH